MNDLDTTIKNLINSAVDLELADHRSAPPLDRSRLAARSPSASPLALWSVPVLAASVAALLAVGTVLTINHDRDRRSNPNQNSTSPAPSISKSTDPNASVAWCPHPGPVYPSTLTYPEATADAVEATEVAGVSVKPVSAEDTAAWSKSFGRPLVKLTGSESPYTQDFRDLKPVPGKSYSFTLKYILPENGDPISVLSISLQDVAAGSCPRPLLVRPNHTYLIRCEVTFLPDATGQLLVTEVNRSAPGSGAGGTVVVPLSGQMGDLARVPEANEVTGISVGPVSDQDDAYVRANVNSPLISDFNGTKDFSGKTTPGKSYPFPVKYIVPRVAYPASVVSMTFQDVASGRCPEPFLVRADHTYLIRCQVTLRAGAAGKLAFHFRSLAGENEDRLDLP